MISSCSRHCRIRRSLVRELQRLPVRTLPFEDELLTSWIIRICADNGLKLRFFERLYGAPIWNRDIDRLAPPRLIGFLSALTTVAPARILAMTLKCYEGVLWDALRPGGIAMWLCPLGIYHRVRVRFGTGVCPDCLREQQYVRREWRLASSIYCARHGTRLLDACSHCDAPILFHRYEQGRRAMTDCSIKTTCWKCGSPFETCARVKDAAVLRLQIQMGEVMQQRWAQLGSATVYVRAWFDGLRLLLALIAGVSRASSGEKLTTRFETERIGCREERIAALATTLTNWPDSFWGICSDLGVRPSELACVNTVSVPFWVADSYNWSNVV